MVGRLFRPIIPSQDYLQHQFAPIVGDPYLFDGWVRGKVESRNPFFANDSLWFNYDLASGKLVATVNQTICGMVYVLSFIPGPRRQYRQMECFGQEIDPTGFCAQF